MLVSKLGAFNFSTKSSLSYAPEERITWVFKIFLKYPFQEHCTKGKQTQKETKKTKSEMWFQELKERDQWKKRVTATETTSQQRDTCLVGTPCMYWTLPPHPHFSQGERSLVHSNACFISPLILIKRILSRLLGITIDWFWHYSCPRGPGLLFQASASLSGPHTSFLVHGASQKQSYQEMLWDVCQVERKKKTSSNKLE